MWKVETREAAPKKQEGGAGEQRRGCRNSVGDPGLDTRGEGREGANERETASRGDACSHTQAPTPPGRRDRLWLPACCCLAIQSQDKLV